MLFCTFWSCFCTISSGFRYLVIERMECPLDDVVPLLLQQHKKSTAKTVANFGPIAEQLLACVQAIHKRKHVVVDIKSENFMLAYGKGKGTTAAQQLGSRIRILDLAMVQPWASIGSHRPNDGTKGLAGTPLYASLNIHNGETPSRRDDLEAIGYILAELVIKCVSGDTSKQLPWSHGQSDEEIGSLKEECVNNKSSDFYKQLGGDAVVKVFTKYMDEVRGYTYEKTPDYESLKTILLELKVPLPAPAKPAAAAKRKITTTTTRRQPTASSTRSKRTTRSQASAAEESPAKIQKDDSHIDIEIIDDSHEESFENTQVETAFLDAREEEDDESFQTAENDASFQTVEMDWEVIPDENQEPGRDAKPKALVGVTVVVSDGPHKGQTIHLIKGKSETFVVGSNPTTKSGEKALKLDDDDEVDESHIRLDLVVSKKLVSVNVTDLQSSGSFVGNEKIRKGKDYKIFRGGSVRIGNSCLVVNPIDPKQVAKATRATSQSSGNSRGSRNQRSPTPVVDEPEETHPEPEIPRLKRRGVQLIVIEGPHKGESFELEHGVTETFIIGSKPSSKAGNLVCLDKDSSLKATHLRLDLAATKKLTAVTITDKSNGRTMINRDVVKNGKAFINDRIKIGNSILEIRSL
jgi:serine/threonine protein kinase